MKLVRKFTNVTKEKQYNKRIRELWMRWSVAVAPGFFTWSIRMQLACCWPQTFQSNGTCTFFHYISTNLLHRPIETTVISHIILFLHILLYKFCLNCGLSVAFVQMNACPMRLDWSVLYQYLLCFSFVLIPHSNLRFGCFAVCKRFDFQAYLE